MELLKDDTVAMWDLQVTTLFWNRSCLSVCVLCVSRDFMREARLQMNEWLHTETHTFTHTYSPKTQHKAHPTTAPAFSTYAHHTSQYPRHPNCPRSPAKLPLIPAIFRGNPRHRRVPHVPAAACPRKTKSQVLQARLSESRRVRRPWLWLRHPLRTWPRLWI